MKKVSAAILALVLTLGCGVSVSLAQTYVSGNLGAVFVDDADFDDDFAGTGEFTFDAGVGFTGAIGSSTVNGGRAELEFGYRVNDIDEVTFDALGTGNLDGDFSALSIMGNVYYDFGREMALSPFVGAGLGMANVEADVDNIDSDDDNVFAYQVMLGLTFLSSAYTNVDLQYRFFATSDPEFDGGEVEYDTHNVMIGLRQSF